MLNQPDEIIHSPLLLIDSTLIYKLTQTPIINCSTLVLRLADCCLPDRELLLVAVLASAAYLYSVGAGVVLIVNAEVILEW